MTNSELEKYTTRIMGIFEGQETQLQETVVIVTHNGQYRTVEDISRYEETRFEGTQELRFALA